MDMNLSEDADIDRHKTMQAEGLTVNLTDEHHPTAIEGVWELRRSLEEMPRQLYAQAVALTDVAWKAFQNGPLYFSQRYPGELARFRWVIDAKDEKRITRYEDWWQVCVMAFLQSRSLREPLMTLRGADYSAFHRNFPSVPMPDYLRSHTDHPEDQVADLSAVFRREMEFATSETQIGLQIADILTNALRRALSARLRPDGWRPLGKLIIHRTEGALRLINLGPGEDVVRTPYSPVINQLNRNGRSMLKQKTRRHR